MNLPSLPHSPLSIDTPRLPLPPSVVTLQSIPYWISSSGSAWAPLPPPQSLSPTVLVPGVSHPCFNVQSQHCSRPRPPHKVFASLNPQPRPPVYLGLQITWQISRGCFASTPWLPARFQLCGLQLYNCAPSLETLRNNPYSTRYKSCTSSPKTTEVIPFKCKFVHCPTTSPKYTISYP